MNQSRFKHLLGILCLGATISSAGILPYTERSLKYPTEQGWQAQLVKHWTYWKAKFNTAGGIIQGTKPDNTSAETSEAQSYGLMLALWFNDKTTFDQIYSATQSNFWGGSNYAWIISPTKDPNFAGDADQDICGALIFASALVDSGYWSNPTNGAPAYKTQAIAVLKEVESGFVDGSNLIRSYNNSSGIYNPSYHMPGWGQIFKEFGAANGVTTTNWDNVRTAEYGLFNKQPFAKDGMARNWSDGSGNAGNPGNGTETPSNGDMSFDAIRVPYRIGLDAIWYPSHTQAIAWCKSVWASGVVIADTAGMYTLSGGSPVLWGWGTRTASPAFSDAQYEWALTIPMWGTAAVAVADSSTAGTAATSRSINRMKPGVMNQSYFVLSANSDTTLATSPNKNYYAQSLALLGTLAMDGLAWNVWDDLKNKWTAPDTNVHVTQALTATPNSVALNGSTTLTAQFSHSISWKLTLTGATSGATYTGLSGTGTSVSAIWTPASEHGLGKSFVAGETVTASLSSSWTTAPTGISTTVSILAANGILPSGAHLSAFSWTSEGLRLPSGLVQDGQVVEVRVLDLSGRQQGAMRSATAHVSDGATVLDLAPQHTAQAGLVELRSGGNVERLMLPPIR